MEQSSHFVLTEAIATIRFHFFPPFSLFTLGHSSLYLRRSGKAFTLICRSVILMQRIAMLAAGLRLYHSRIYLTIRPRSLRTVPATHRTQWALVVVPALLHCKTPFIPGLTSLRTSRCSQRAPRGCGSGWNCSGACCQSFCP